MADKKPEKERYEQPPDLSPEDEKALDRAWERIAKEDEERKRKDKKK